MKIKWSWWVFLPLFVASLGLKVYQLFFTDGVQAIGGLSQFRFGYLIDAVIGVMMILTIIIALTDRQTKNLYIPHRNITAGILGILTGAAVLVNAGCKFMEMYRTAVYSVMWVISIPLAVLAVLGMVITSISLFSGKSNYKDISVMYLFPSVWSFAKLIALFLENRDLSVRNNDFTNMIAYSILTLFLFYQAALMVDIDTERATIKKNFIYGFGAASFMIVYGLGQAKAVIDNRAVMGDILVQNIANSSELILFGLYIIAFLASVGAKAEYKQPIANNAMEDNFRLIFKDYMDNADKDRGNEEICFQSYDDAADIQLGDDEVILVNAETHDNTQQDTDENTDTVAESDYRQAMSLSPCDFSKANDMLDKMLKELE